MEPGELKNKVEAVLFSAGKKVNIDYIAKLVRSNKDEVIKALQELKTDYSSKNSSLSVIDEGEFWKLNVRENYSPIVRKIVPDAELTRTMIETLAVIAWKAPVLQSEVIRIRTNKAYDHIAEIEKAGMVSKEKHGRTQIIKLTQRFYDYFDVHNEEEIKNKFKGFKEQAEKEAPQEEDQKENTEQKQNEPTPASVSEVQKQDEVPAQQ